MTRLEDDLEAGLRALQDGDTVGDARSSLPGSSTELSALLSAARAAYEAGLIDIPEETRRRIRSRFLQRAAEMRENPPARHPRSLRPFPRVAITLGLVLVFALTSTGLVRASSGAVPGDQLYGIKRSWEGLRLLLSRQPTVQYMLASEFEQERLDEIDELLLRRRLASVSFSGVVSLKADGTWTVSGVPVLVPATAMLPPTPILQGQPVMVSGTTRPDGTVEASRIDLLLPGVALPPLAPSEDELQHEALEGLPLLDNGVPNNAVQAPASGYVTYEFTGVVERLGASQWQINRQPVDVSRATVLGNIEVGTEIRFNGYYAPNGTLVATWIQATANLRHDDGRDASQRSGDTGSGDDTEHDDGHDDDAATSD